MPCIIAEYFYLKQKFETFNVMLKHDMLGTYLN